VFLQILFLLQFRDSGFPWDSLGIRDSLSGFPRDSGFPGDSGFPRDSGFPGSGFPRDSGFPGARVLLYNVLLLLLYCIVVIVVLYCCYCCVYCCMLYYKSYTVLRVSWGSGIRRNVCCMLKLNVENVNVENVECCIVC